MQEPEWQKLLWLQQPFPDNHVPPSFLTNLTRNANFHPYAYVDVLMHSCAVTQQLCLIAIFLSVFVYLLQGRLDPDLLIAVSCLSFLFVYVARELSPDPIRSSRQQRAKALKSSILVILSLATLSPVLRTLTASTSSDSIWAITACLFVINIVLTDYRVPTSLARREDRLTSVISVNAAISAAVVLASRLSEDAAVFSLVLLSILFFGQIPNIRSQPRKTRNATKLATTLALALISLVLSSGSSLLYGYLTGITVCFTTFVAPALLIWAQQFKNEIRGPWDVASPGVQAARPT